MQTYKRDLDMKRRKKCSRDRQESVVDESNETIFILSQPLTFRLFYPPRGLPGLGDEHPSIAKDLEEQRLLHTQANIARITPDLGLQHRTTPTLLDHHLQRQQGHMLQGEISMTSGKTSTWKERPSNQQFRTERDYRSPRSPDATR
ncbi:unnamed protein product [Cylicocyclus nassatus]|uniref:Uncharacterized protein n=1 Tax=Cylicocyclus nassatus TaxID=53992 RepID=A0AA36H2K9_CYLNA|nr:unnamed protein product [Cylicocyclus nassatus]